MTSEEIDQKILEQKIVKGKWPEETHEIKHKRMFDNLIELLSDIENSSTAETLPATKENAIDWDKISISYLTQWSLMNCSKIIHEHGDKNVTPSRTD